MSCLWHTTKPSAFPQVVLSEEQYFAPLAIFVEGHTKRAKTDNFILLISKILRLSFSIVDSVLLEALFKYWAPNSTVAAKSQSNGHTHLPDPHSAFQGNS